MTDTRSSDPQLYASAPGYETMTASIESRNAALAGFAKECAKAGKRCALRLKETDTGDDIVDRIYGMVKVAAPARILPSLTHDPSPEPVRPLRGRAAPRGHPHPGPCYPPDLRGPVQANDLVGPGDTAQVHLRHRAGQRDGGHLAAPREARRGGGRHQRQPHGYQLRGLDGREQRDHPEHV